MYCPKCGKQNADDSAFCVGCGASLLNSFADEKAEREEVSASPESAAKPNSEPPYLKYCDKVQKINMLTLVTQILTILMVITLIFIPIYRSSYEVNIEDIENMEELNEALENDGKITKSFSLFEDFLKIGSAFFGDEDPGDVVFLLYSAFFPLFEIVFSIVLLCMVVPKIINGINARQDIKNSTMLKYNEMKLTGSKQTRQNFFRQQSIVSIIVYAAFDIVFTLIFGKLFDSVSDMSNGEFVSSSTRYMDGFSGFSGWVFLLLAMLVAFIVLRSMIKKEEKAMLLEITQEQYN